MRIINRVVMVLAGLLLIVASVLKFIELLNICIPSWTENKYGFWESYEFFLVQIPLEFALGVWLFSGLFRKAAWIAGTLAYLCFIGVTIFKIVTGAESCGCFGQVHVDPRITLFAIDVPLFLLLAIFRPKGQRLLPPPWPNTFYLLAVFVPTIAMMVLAAPALVTFRPECQKAHAVQPIQDAKLLLELHKIKQQLLQEQKQSAQLKLELEKLRTEADSLREQIEASKKTQAAPAAAQIINEPKPEPAVEQQQTAQENNSAPAAPAANHWEWLQYVVEDDVKSELSTGLDIVLMYHHDCPICADMVPKYSEYCKQMAQQGNDEFRITFLAVPPIAETGPVPADTQCVKGTLTDKQNWRIMSPYVVALLEGQLVKTWKEGSAPEPEKLLDEVFQ